MNEAPIIREENASFYSITSTQNGEKISITSAKVIQFWENKGYRRFKTPKGDYTLIKLKNKSIICEVHDDELMHEVKQQLINIENRFDVWTAFIESDFISKKNKMAVQLMADFKLNLSDKNTTYFFFTNGVLKVTPYTKELISYTDYEGYVFENQIIEHNIVLTEETEKYQSDFDVFLRNVTNNKEDRYNFLTTAIGYLIHGFKCPSITKAVIIIDEVLSSSGEANGGTGKSLIGKAISEITNTLTKDGKTLNTKGNNFFYQDLNPSHRVLYLDDVNKDLDFEYFYSVITGSITIEEKYKSPYTIPYEESPKLLITSNYMVNGSGGNSDDRRRIEMEIYPHYSKGFTPFDEFGKNLFNDWNQEEYNSFFNTMAEYAQKFMINGIMYSSPINLTENKLILATDISFVEFADINIVFNIGEEKITKNKTSLYQNYKENYSLESRNLSNIKFGRWLTIWAKARNYRDHSRKSDGNNLIDFHKDIYPKETQIIIVD